MSRYRLITLIDITRTDCPRTETDPVKIGQQANFNSLVQAIGLRANVQWENDPEPRTGILPDPLDGKCRHWCWEFDTEHDDIFLKEGDPVGHLIDDLHNVPIISDLTNDVDLYPSAIQTTGNKVNTWIRII